MYIQRIKLKHMKKLIVLVVLVSIVLTSCSSSRNGYGCKGRSKWITGHRPDGYGY